MDEVLIVYFNDNLCYNVCIGNTNGGYMRELELYVSHNEDFGRHIVYSFTNAISIDREKLSQFLRLAKNFNPYYYNHRNFFERSRYMFLRSQK